MNDAILTRLPYEADLLRAIEDICREKGISKAAVSVIGALKKASLGYYLQDEKRYVAHDIPDAVEILAGVGSVSLKDGEPFVHLHLTLSDKDFKALGGHANKGCVIFAAEALITPLGGAIPHRVYDETTGLFLWEQAGK